MKEFSYLFIHDYKYFYSSIEKYLQKYNNVLIISKEQANSKFWDSKKAQEIYDEIIVIDDIFSIDEIKSKIRNLKVSNVICLNEYYIPLAAELRTVLNIQGLNNEKIDFVTNKYEMKKFFKKHGLPVTKFALVSSIEELKCEYNNFSKPIIIKPLYGSGGKGIYKIKEEKDINGLSELFINSQRYLIEEYILGREYHVDTVYQNGEILVNVIGKYTSDNILEAVNRNEGHGTIIIPSKYYEYGMLKDLIELNKKVIKLLDIDKTIFHAEYYINDYGEIYFGEVAARIGGGPRVVPAVEAVFGLDWFDVYIRLQEEKQIHINETNKFAGSMSFISDRIGKEVKEISTEQEFSQWDDLVYISILREKGDIITANNSTSNRLGHIVLENYSYQDLIDRLHYATKTFKLEI